MTVHIGFGPMSSMATDASLGKALGKAEVMDIALEFGFGCFIGITAFMVHCWIRSIFNDLGQEHLQSTRDNSLVSQAALIYLAELSKR